MRALTLTVAIACILASVAHAETYFQRGLGKLGSANCTEWYHTQFADHFTFGTRSGWPQTYQQRVLTYDKFYRPGGPVFFYVGNEAPITAFADIAGLMWENAEEFGAALVFAEHRFYGKSFPQCPNSDCYGLLSTMQAMADYATLMVNLTNKDTGMFASSRGIITFGGSYGGMLSAWMRMKYPNVVTGAIACSAPVEMVSPSYDTSKYWAVVTRDATSAGGSDAACAPGVYSALQAAFAQLATPTGAAAIAEKFRACSSQVTAKEFGYWVQAAFDVMAMGDYPFPIDFMFGTPSNPAPAWPMRVACNSFAGVDPSANGTVLLDALFNAVSVYYNVTGDVKCFDMAQNPTTGSSWDYMVCSERIINELPYFSATGWPNDMFWPQPVWTEANYTEYCGNKYGVTPRFGWLNTTYGGTNVHGATKIVFSNGLLDPWHSGGILSNVSETVKAYIIPEGAHHLDLLFSSPNDPASVTFVRRKEMEHVRDWLRELRK